MLKKKKLTMLKSESLQLLVITFNYYVDEYKLFETLYIYIYVYREREFKLHLV